jgi:methylenetetrahydrofolate dehydrogenase (NADP+)/methenyltetrahydrofolate cyclohydrolase
MQLLLAEPIIEQIYPKIPSGLTLAVVLVGNDPASQLYVSKKKQTLETLGGELVVHQFKKTVNQTDLIARIQGINNDSKTDGIIVQLPLPKHLDTRAVINSITPAKDADGLTAHSLGLLMQARTTKDIPSIIPATPKGILYLLKYYHIPIKGQHVVIINDSYLVGRPLAHLVSALGGTATICNRHTPDLSRHVDQADILVTATGQQDLLHTEDFANTPAIIDVGIHRNSQRTLSGDIYHKELSYNGLITPVPGGVGPLTVACLIENLHVLKSTY